MATEGVSKALFEWAKGFGSYGSQLRLNAVTETEGGAFLVTSSGVTSQTFIDGTKDRTVYFSLVLVEPWSEDIDTLNTTAMQKGEAWLDWVSTTTTKPDLGSREVLEIAVDDETPVLVQVLSDETCARYQFRAHLIYRD